MYDNERNGMFQNRQTDRQTLVLFKVAGRAKELVSSNSFHAT
jgi:hypothetical protein